MQTESEKQGAEPQPQAAAAEQEAATATPEHSPAVPAPGPRPIAELLDHPEFPKSAMGELVDIGGYTGVVVDVVNLSLKVRSPEGVTKSFNANGLRRIYGRVIPPEPPRIPDPPRRTVEPRSREPEQPLPPPPPPPVIEPDFTKPVKKISEFTKRSDYPQCLLGEHLEIAGYAGVVVQIVNRSLKVRSPAEVTRSYNADALKRLYGQ